MVRMLKAEFQYYQMWIISMIAAFVFAEIFFLNWANVNFSEAISITLNAMLVFVGIIRLSHIVRIKKENGDRLLLLLPIRIKQIAYLRIIFGILLWLIMSVFYWVIIVIVIPEFVFIQIFSSYLAWTGVWLIVNAFYLFSNDIKYYTTGRMKRKIIVTVLATVTILSMVLIVKHIVIDDAVPFGLNTSLFSALSVLSLGLFINMLDIYLFTRRKFYLD